MSQENNNNSTIEKKDEKTLEPIKRPLTPYFLFCKYKREELRKKGIEKISAKELGIFWKNMSDSDKKPFFDDYKILKQKYDNFIKRISSNKTDSEDTATAEANIKGKKKRLGKVKVKTSIKENKKNNKKSCNCGGCDECKKNKKKKLNDSDEEDDDEK